MHPVQKAALILSGYSFIGKRFLKFYYHQNVKLRVLVYFLEIKIQFVINLLKQVLYAGPSAAE